MKIFFIILFLLATIFLNAKEPKLVHKFEKEVSKFYHVDDITLSEIAELSSGKDLFYNVFAKTERIGRAVLTSASGRFDHFDFMIVFNNEFQIVYLKILTYRSQYGAEIMSKKWLKQFYNKQPAAFNYGNDIQAISGATLSAQSLTQTINDIKKKLHQEFSD